MHVAANETGTMYTCMFIGVKFYIHVMKNINSIHTAKPADKIRTLL